MTLDVRIEIFVFRNGTAKALITIPRKGQKPLTAETFFKSKEEAMSKLKEGMSKIGDVTKWSVS